MFLLPRRLQWSRRRSFSGALGALAGPMAPSEEHLETVLANVTGFTAHMADFKRAFGRL